MNAFSLPSPLTRLWACSLVIVLSFIFTLGLQAQYPDSFVVEVPVPIEVSNTAEVFADRFPEWMAKQYGLRTDDSLAFISSFTDELGMRHTSYQQYYRSIPVEFSTLKAHGKGEKVDLATGTFFLGLNNQATPHLSHEDAAQGAAGYSGCSNYSASLAKLVWYHQGFWSKDLQSNFHLTYKVRVTEDGGARTWDIYVNAKDGSLIAMLPLFSNCSTGSATTTWHGTQTIKTSIQGGSYILLDDCQASNIRTRDWNNGGTPLDFIDANNSWTATNQRSAVTGHWAAKRSREYFGTVHGRTSWDGNGGDVDLRVNAIVNGSGNNASFNWGTGIMMLGRGSSTTSYTDDFNTIDITGHEYAHGVTGTTANLTYSYEPGALNESFSDIFGTCIQIWEEGSNNWTIGDDLSIGAIRSMSNPNSHNQPDTYLGTYWYTGSGDYGGVHTNSGVQNFWFYLLSQGGSGTNDISNSYSVSGIGITAARAIAYRNLSVYLGPSSNHYSARAGSIQAARDLYGVGSSQEIAVTNAWYAVGVGAAYGPTSTGCTCTFAGTQYPSNTLTPTSSWQTLNCQYAGEYSVYNVVNGNSYQWSYCNGDGASSPYDNRLNLYIHSNGSYITCSGDACGLDAKINWVATFTGQVRVLTNQYFSSSNPCGTNSTCSNLAYRMNSGSTTGCTSDSHEPDNSSGSAYSIGSQTSYSASNLCLTAGDLDWYSFQYSGSTYYFKVRGFSNSSAGSYGINFSRSGSSVTIETVPYNGSTTDTYLELYASDAVTLLDDDDDNGTGYFSRIVYTLCSVTASVSPSGPTTFCQGGSVTLTATGGSSYLWNTGATTSSISVSTSGNYSVTVTNSGCSAVSSPVTVTVNPGPGTPNITPSGPTTFCTGGSVTLSASPANSYQWSNGATSSSIQVTTSGSYSVTVTDGSGCSATSSPITITVNQGPSTPVVTPNGPTSFCAGGSVTLSAGSNGSYQWSNGATSSSIVVTTSGTYSVTVTSSGCSATSNPVTVTVNQGPGTPVITPSGPTSFCSGGSVTLSASPASSYQWSNGATSSSIVVTTSGFYSVTVTDGSGCSATSISVSVTVNQAPPQATITPSGPTTFCAGSSVVLTATTGTSYLWSNGSTSQSITVTNPGTYTVNVYQGSCSSTSAPVFVVVNPSPPTPSVSHSTPTSFCDGASVVLTSSSPTGNLWAPTGQMTASITATTSGSYSVQVTNSGGCSSTSAPVSVTVWPNPPIPTVTIVSSSIFSSSPSGNQWYLNGLPMPGEVQSFVTPVVSGSYHVEVTDANGCSSASLPVNFTLTGLGEVLGGSKLDVFPSPFSNWISVRWEGHNNQVVGLTLTDMAGRTLFSAEQHGVSQEWKLEVPPLPSGIYFATVTTDGGASQVVKLIRE